MYHKDAKRVLETPKWQPESIDEYQMRLIIKFVYCFLKKMADENSTFPPLNFYGRSQCFIYPLGKIQETIWFFMDSY